MKVIWEGGREGRKTDKRYGVNVYILNSYFMLIIHSVVCLVKGVSFE